MTQAPKNKKLFEDFFIIGPSQDDMESFVKQNSDKSRGILPAKILSSYPSNISCTNEAPRASIPDFTFPFGAEIKRIKSTPSFSGLNPIIYTSSDYEQRSRCFAFPLLSRNFEAPEEPESVWGEVIQTSNPDKLLYIICINFKDFVTMSDKGSKDKKSLSRVKYWEVNKAMCFMSYYPFTTFFFDVLMKILNLLKVERMVKMTELTPTDLDRHESVDMKFTDNFFENVIKKNLGALLSANIPTFGALLNFKLLGSFAETQIEFKLDQQNLAYTFEVSWACTVVFRYITYKDLLWFYTALLLERKLVFLTSNIHLLTAILFVLKSLIKPFSYPFPLIFNLPEVLTVYCDAPGAALIGINKGEEYLKEQELFQQYPSCIFVCLDEEKMYLDPENNVQSVQFNNFERPLITYYTKLNSNFNRAIVEAKKSSKRIANKHESIKLTEDHEEREKSFKIMELFKETIEKKLLSFIPSRPIYKNNNKELDYDEIGRIIMARAKDVDKKFLKEFLQTQIWAYYVEMHYSNQ